MAKRENLQLVSFLHDQRVWDMLTYNSFYISRAKKDYFLTWTGRLFCPLYVKYLTKLVIKKFILLNAINVPRGYAPRARKSAHSAKIDFFTTRE